MITIRGAKYALIGLEDLCQSIPEDYRNMMVEIGCYVGDSTKVFQRYFKKIYAIDPWENGYDDTDASSFIYPMNEIEAQFDGWADKCSNIEKKKMKSIDAVEYFRDGCLDLVYIDAKHTYESVKEDIELWRPKLREGGYLCGHDYQGKFPGVIKAVDEFKKPNQVFRDTSWYIKL